MYPECGHATRTAVQFFDSWFGDELAGIERVNIVPLVHSYLAEGRIRVKPEVFDMPLTYHDPCNLGRNVGSFEEPRELINERRHRLPGTDAQPGTKLVLRWRRRPDRRYGHV